MDLSLIATQGQLMAAQNIQHTEADLQDKGRKALNAVLNLLERWDLAEKDKMLLLGMSRSTYFKAKSEPGAARISPDLLERLSYLLNIHLALRTLFNNEANVYGFIKQPNGNGVFGGMSPLEYMSAGTVASLYETARHLDGLRGGGW